MPAIAGIHNAESSPSQAQDLVAKMLRAMKHRGAMANIIANAPNLCLGFACAHGLSTHGATDGVFLAIDGEVYEPASKPERYEFGPHGLDAAIDAYRVHGDDFAMRIDGTYSGALWDEAERKLILFRDRLGTKPLFYCKSGDSLLFASEVKGILAVAPSLGAPDLRAINYFLSYGYVPNPFTMIESISQVRPGHLLICRDDRITEKRYWQFIQLRPPLDLPANSSAERDLTDKFRSLLKSSVRKRLRNHPSFGAFLSGGLDTSSVVAILHELGASPFKVFTAGFAERDFNEIDDAKVVAEHFGLEHHCVVVDYDDDFTALLERLVWLHDSPFADTSAIPSYFVASLAQRHVDTVFTGDFPDQLIGGSGHHVRTLARAREDSAWRRSLRHPLMATLARRSWRASDTTVPSRLKRWFYRESFPLEEQRIILSMPLPPLLKNCIYSREMRELNERNEPLLPARILFRESGCEDILGKLLYFDVASYAVDDLMIKVDRTCAAHGVAAISPFHDNELVEFVGTLPNEMKIRGSARKYILREAMRPYLPKHTMEKKKQGFAMPIGNWLKTHLSEYVRDILFDQRTLHRGYFDRTALTKIVNDFLCGRTDYASGSESAIISLITLELWHRLFLEGHFGG